MNKSYKPCGKRIFHKKIHVEICTEACEKMESYKQPRKNGPLLHMLSTGYSHKNVHKNSSFFLFNSFNSKNFKNQPALSFFLMVSMLFFREESPDVSLSRTLLSPLIIVEWSRFPRRIPMAL